MIEEYALRIGQLLNKITKQSNRPETLLKLLINGGEKEWQPIIVYTKYLLFESKCHCTLK